MASGESSTAVDSAALEANNDSKNDNKDHDDDKKDATDPAPRKEGGLVSIALDKNVSYEIPNRESMDKETFWWTRQEIAQARKESYMMAQVRVHVASKLALDGIEYEDPDMLEDRIDEIASWEPGEIADFLQKPTPSPPKRTFIPSNKPKNSDTTKDKKSEKEEYMMKQIKLHVQQKLLQLEDYEDRPHLLQERASEICAWEPGRIADFLQTPIPTTKRKIMKKTDSFDLAMASKSANHKRQKMENDDDDSDGDDDDDSSASSAASGSEDSNSEEEEADENDTDDHVYDWDNPEPSESEAMNDDSISQSNDEDPSESEGTDNVYDWDSAKTPQEDDMEEEDSENPSTTIAQSGTIQQDTTTEDDILSAFSIAPETTTSDTRPTNEKDDDVEMAPDDEMDAQKNSAQEKQESEAQEVQGVDDSDILGAFSMFSDDDDTSKHTTRGASGKSQGTDKKKKAVPPSLLEQDGKSDALSISNKEGKVTMPTDATTTKQTAANHENSTDTKSILKDGTENNKNVESEDVVSISNDSTTDKSKDTTGETSTTAFAAQPATPVAPLFALLDKKLPQDSKADDPTAATSASQSAAPVAPLFALLDKKLPQDSKKEDSTAVSTTDKKREKEKATAKSAIAATVAQPDRAAPLFSLLNKNPSDPTKSDATATAKSASDKREKKALLSDDADTTTDTSSLSSSSPSSPGGVDILHAISEMSSDRVFLSSEDYLWWGIAVLGLLLAMVVAVHLALGQKISDLQQQIEEGVIGDVFETENLLEPEQNQEIPIL